MFRRQRRMNFWYSLILSLLTLAILPLIFLSYLSYPPEPRDWVYLVGILFCLLMMLPGLIRDGRWLFQKRWQHLPAIDHRAKIPRGITLRAAAGGAVHLNRCHCGKPSLFGERSDGICAGQRGPRRSTGADPR